MNDCLMLEKKSPLSLNRTSKIGSTATFNPNLIINLSDNNEEIIKNSFTNKEIDLKKIKLNFYDKKELPKNNNDYTCSICLHLVNSPQICFECENLFCDFCINKWLEKSSLCSYCRKEFKSSSIPRIIRNSLELIEIKCPSELCEDLIVLKDLKEHLEIKCAQTVKEFECNFCSEKLSCKKDSRLLFEHMNACGKIRITCGLCNVILSKKEYKTHFDECEKTHFECEYCAKKILAKELKEHSKEACLDILRFHRLEIEKLKSDIEHLKAINNEYLVNFKIMEMTKNNTPFCINNKISGLKFSGFNYGTNTNNLDSSSYLSNYQTNKNDNISNKNLNTDKKNIKCEDVETIYQIVKSLEDSNKSKMKIDSINNHIYYNNGTIYCGEIRQNKENGTGTLYKLRLFKTYEGEFRNGKYHGKGTQYYENGDKYKGEFIKDKKSGFGKFFWNQDPWRGDLYEGNWENNKRNGFGTYYKNKKFISYKGEYKENKLSGKGIDFYENGRYEGDFTNDARNGLGTYYWFNNEKYEGYWKNGLKNGNGKFYDKNGNLRYEGNFEDGFYEGKGVLYDFDKDWKYEGEFLKNKKHGKGFVFYNFSKAENADLIKFNGEFKNDMKNGYGVLIDLNTKKVIEDGVYKDDFFIGK